MTTVTRGVREKPKAIDVSALREANTPNVWVINTAANIIKQRGDIVFAIRTSRNEEVQVAVPSTWIPINLSEQVTKGDIVAAPQFMRMVNRRFLTIISDVDADKLRLDPGYEAEQDRILALQTQVVGPEEMAPGKGGDDDPQLPKPDNTEFYSDAVPSGVRQIVQEIVTRADYSNEQKLVEIKREIMSETMTADDLRYVIGKLDDPKIIKLVAEEISAMGVK